MKLFDYFRRSARVQHRSRDIKITPDSNEIFIFKDSFNESEFCERYPILKQSPYDAIHFSYVTSTNSPFVDISASEDAKIGVDLYSNGHYFQAHDYLRRASDNGDPMGMTYYGLYKWQINDNTIESAILFKSAMRELYPEAMFNLAQLYFSLYRNDGHEIRLNEVFFLYLKASVIGDARAQTNLAELYLCGRGVEKDIEKGLSWLELAVDGGDPMALNNLGWYYLNGEFVDRDTEKGLKLLQRAVDSGCAWAIPNLAWCYLNGNGVEKDYEKAHQLYLREIENKRFFDAIDTFETLFANFYMGRGTECNDLEAMKCLLRYSLSRDVEPMINRWIEDRGEENFKKVLENALRSFVDDAVNNNKYSQFVCGALCEIGEFVPQDIGTALYWYNQSLHNGHTQALWNYKRLFKKKNFVEGNNSGIILY